MLGPGPEGVAAPGSKLAVHSGWLGPLVGQEQRQSRSGG
jgi:hypothetical protein